MHKALLGITMGDPTGIGPEVIVGAWSDPALHAAARLVVIGRVEVLRRAARLLGQAVEVVEVSEPAEVASSPQVLPCLSCGSAQADEAPPAQVDRRGGQAAYDALIRAAELALVQHLDGIVTAPLNKAALWAAGHRYPGHTELLAELCGVERTAMMLYLAQGHGVRGRVGLGVVHVTLHQALREVVQQLNTGEIAHKARLADRALSSFLEAEAIAARPRIGVSALNPHAGEAGLFGDEEQRIIAPAVEQVQREGLDISGPFPADTLLMRAAQGEFDAVVAMYHDQGHIALKLLGIHHAVNVTLGLPIVRTSVAHGTAHDLAWQGRAETSGIVEAVRVAAQLAHARSSNVPLAQAEGPSRRPQNDRGREPHFSLGQRDARDASLPDGDPRRCVI